MIELHKGGCLEVMDQLIEKGIKVDAIITDTPYGTTACKWDSVIPFTWHIIDTKGRIIYIQDALQNNISLEYFNKNKKQGMWERLNKLIKPNGAIVLFGSEPFSSALRMSNIKNYKYDWVWEKSQAVGHLNSWKQPMRNTENILVFYSKQCNYFPILESKPIKNQRPKTNRTKQTDCYGIHDLNVHKCPIDKTMPKTTIRFNNAQKTTHPTQKPVKLMEYLIKTYTNDGELVLDFTMGSGTTMVACKNLNRNGIGIEMDDKYFKIAVERVGAGSVQVIGSVTPKQPTTLDTLYSTVFKKKAQNE